MLTTLMLSLGVLFIGYVIVVLLQLYSPPKLPLVASPNSPLVIAHTTRALLINTLTLPSCPR